MPHVTNSEYFHVISEDKDRQFWDAYQKSSTKFITDSTKFNPSYEAVKKWSPKIVTDNPRPKLVGRDPILTLESLTKILIDGPKKQHFQEVIQELYQWSRQYWEVKFEEIRKEKFPQLPSRLHCLYLCDNDSKDFWINHAKLGKKKIWLCTFNVTGEIHRADSKWVDIDIEEDDKIIEYATKYWEGEMSESGKTERNENLFCGTVEVLDISPIK